MDGFAGNACIVGAAGGIGAATTRALRAGGAASLALLDMDTPALAALAAETGAASATLDARDQASVLAALDAARRAMPRLDALVVCTGIVDTRPIDQLALEIKRSISGCDKLRTDMLVVNCFS
jgi:short-subunit dehydrogenase